MINLLKLILYKGNSSVGRTVVFKTKGQGFKSLLYCHEIFYNALETLEHRFFGYFEVT